MNNENLQNELWKDIPGYEGIYQASSYGRVKSLDRLICAGKARYIISGKLLKPKITKDGYEQFALSNKRQVKDFTGHRLVAITFIPNPSAKIGAAIYSTPCQNKLLV